MVGLSSMVTKECNQNHRGSLETSTHVVSCGACKYNYHKRLPNLPPPLLASPTAGYSATRFPFSPQILSSQIYPSISSNFHYPSLNSSSPDSLFLAIFQMVALAYVRNMALIVHTDQILRLTKAFLLIDMHRLQIEHSLANCRCILYHTVFLLSFLSSYAYAPLLHHSLPIPIKNNCDCQKGKMKFLDWYAKIAVVSALVGASMELFMIKTGFCVRTLHFLVNILFTNVALCSSFDLCDDKVTALESEKRAWENSPEAQAVKEALNPWRDHDSKVKENA
ncbi:hypothetical protein AKJ16_DCAP01142 [Drosera capensis]